MSDAGQPEGAPGLYGALAPESRQGAARSPRLRLARLLLDLAGRAGTSSPGGAAIPFGLTQEELASLLGLSRPAVARTLRQLRRQGVIGTGYRAVTVTGPGALGDAAAAFA